MAATTVSVNAQRATVSLVSPANVVRTSNPDRKPASSVAVTTERLVCVASTPAPTSKLFGKKLFPKLETHNPADAAARRRASNEAFEECSKNWPDCDDVFPIAATCDRFSPKTAHRCASANGANAAVAAAQEFVCAARSANADAVKNKPVAPALTIEKSGCPAMPANTGATRCVQISNRTEVRWRSMADTTTDASLSTANGRGNGVAKGIAWICARVAGSK
mmetsp:Transcript_4423/g.16368  ORF Transcript_4423/g.16368 Transcript_4423/m.16368 type:complete len:221 (-) Transcript_4423:2466-3128(-)